MPKSPTALLHRAKERTSASLFVPATIALSCTALFIVLTGQYTDLDLYLADLYYDPVRQLFPWDRSWFGRDFMHGYLKNVIVWSGFLLIAAALADLARPWRRLSPLRRLQLRFLALAATLEPLLVRSLKQASNLHCPFAIDRYGGSEPLLRLLDAVPAGWHPGHCFPAGHASAGMWLSALAILWLPRQPRRALAAFAGGLAIGLTMGWVQQMRGMHFLSHTLATAWISSALLLAMLALFRKPLQAAAGQSNAATRAAGATSAPVAGELAGSRR